MSFTSVTKTFNQLAVPNARYLQGEQEAYGDITTVRPCRVTPYSYKEHPEDTSQQVAITPCAADAYRRHENYRFLGLPRMAHVRDCGAR